MAKPLHEPGLVLDGFRLEERVHRGGMATLWRVSRPGMTAPMLMKVPRIGEGADPAAIVSFEMEQMILLRDRRARAESLWRRRFRRPALYRDGMDRRADIISAARRAAFALCRGRRHRRESRDRSGRSASATCHPSRHQAEQHRDTAGRRSRAA